MCFCKNLQCYASKQPSKSTQRADDEFTSLQVGSFLQPCLLTRAHFVSFIPSTDPLETFLYIVSSTSKQCLFSRQHYCTLLRTCSLMVCLLKQKVSSGLWPMHLSSCWLVHCIFCSLGCALKYISCVTDTLSMFLSDTEHIKEKKRTPMVEDFVVCGFTGLCLPCLLPQLLISHFPELLSTFFRKQT